MTIVVDVDPSLRSLVIKQMNRLINVLQATDLTDSRAVVREMILIRAKAPVDKRTAILKEAEIFGARVIDSSVEGFVLEATGDPEKLEEFIEIMRSYGEFDVIRSGRVAISLEGKKPRLAPPVPTGSGADRLK
jgi:acetolactate synthase-1/3 small subunit